MQLLAKKSVLSRHEDTELLGMYQGAKGAPATKRQVARRRLVVNKKAPSGWDGDAFADGAKSAKRELSSQDGAKDSEVRHEWRKARRSFGKE